MLRLSRLTDYGLLLVTYLAQHPAPAVHTARDLAVAVNLPAPTVSKLLKRLAREGLLASHRGVQGGYTLARPPEDITLAEVVTALEGPVSLTLCSQHDGACDLESRCPSAGNMRVINQAIRETFERIPLSQMLRPIAPDFVTFGPRGRFPLAPRPAPTLTQGGIE